MENSKQPAFPLSVEAEQRILEGDGFLEIGLTKREYFAGLAMQGLLASAKYNNSTSARDILIRDSIAHADELLKQLESKSE